MPSATAGQFSEPICSARVVLTITELKIVNGTISCQNKKRGLGSSTDLTDHQRAHNSQNLRRNSFLCLEGRAGRWMLGEGNKEKESAI